MDDNVALERHIGAVLGRMGGPEPTFDAMAIARSAATQPSTRRSRSLFGTAPMVLAGVVVALFGAVLLTVIAERPTEPDLVKSTSPERTRYRSKSAARAGGR